MFTQSGSRLPVGQFAALAILVILSLAIFFRVSSPPAQVAGTSTENSSP